MNKATRLLPIFMNRHPPNKLLKLTNPDFTTGFEFQEIAASVQETGGLHITYSTKSQPYVNYSMAKSHLSIFASKITKMEFVQSPLGLSSEYLSVFSQSEVDQKYTERRFKFKKMFYCNAQIQRSKFQSNYSLKQESIMSHPLLKY